MANTSDIYAVTEILFINYLIIDVGILSARYLIYSAQCTKLAILNKIMKKKNNKFAIQMVL